MALARLFFAIGLMLLVFTGSAPARPLESVLDLGMGVRPAGLGEAFTGLADDEYALYYNPAGLTRLTQTQLSALFESHFTESLYMSAAAGMKMLGLGLIFFDLGTMPYTDAAGQEKGNFGYSSFALLLAGGFSLPFDLSAGLRLKFTSYSTADPSAGDPKVGLGGGALGIDPSFLWAPDGLTLGPISDWRVGALFELPGLSWTKDENFPFGARVGLSFKVIRALIVATDFSLTDGFHLGLEYSLKDAIPSVQQLDIRLGLLTRGGFQFTAGLGVLISGITVDYAFVSHEAGGSHRLSASYTLHFSLFR
jgi:hypothetical protein